MEAIAAPVDKRLVKMELTPERFLKSTNRGDNQIYIFKHSEAPNTMLEVGRLREFAFRLAGGGTGRSLDIDDHDTNENPYTQLIVWDPKAEEIVGGYRYILGSDCRSPLDLSTSELFHFSEDFLQQILPVTIELGRSFVQPEYQNTRTNPKSIYALDNLWDGLGGLVEKYDKAKFFFGKVTMYPNYNVQARDTLHYFLRKYFLDQDGLVVPIHALPMELCPERFSRIFVGSDYSEDLKILNKELKQYQERIPPLINSYMSLSPSMRVFGTAINHEFGKVEETGILIDIDDIYWEKIERHVGVQRLGFLARLRLRRERKLNKTAR